MFQGSLVALITPFSSNGRIDTKALESLIEWQINEGTDGIVCCGTTGEACTLSETDRKKVIEICVKSADGRIPIIAGTGTCDTRQTVRFTATAQRLGAAGCLVVTPYYNKPTQRGCLAHFREVSNVGFPIIAYNNPGRAVIRFTVELVQGLSALPSVVAIKDSSRDLEFVRALRKVTSLMILSGEDDLTFDIIQEGGAGVISVIGNVVPRGWREMVHLALAGQKEKAERLAHRYAPLCKGEFLETNPQCIKYLVSQMGKCKPVFRLPLVLPTLQTQNSLKQIVLELALPFKTLRAKERSF
ncbi:MAG: 4-hydroxy-tetrahydrodipicolinate synthase [Verrucomicrobiota bacterium]|nr:4-hydroxy-tetrahydrodipicolinate synthase [Verrucomicrobiota bacterium]